MVCILKPYAFLAEQVSNLIVRIVGVDPNASIDDVTEEVYRMLGLIRGILDTKQPRRLFVACFLAFLHQGSITSLRLTIKKPKT